MGRGQGLGHRVARHSVRRLHGQDLEGYRLGADWRCGALQAQVLDHRRRAARQVLPVRQAPALHRRDHLPGSLEPQVRMEKRADRRPPGPGLESDPLHPPEREGGLQRGLEPGVPVHREHQAEPRHRRRHQVEPNRPLLLSRQVRSSRLSPGRPGPIGEIATRHLAVARDETTVEMQPHEADGPRALDSVRQPGRRHPMNVLERDFFTDPEIIQDPVPYYRALHERGPVVREPHKGVFMLSRIDEILEVYTDHERFSAIVGPLGPMVDVPEPAPGESWAEVIERRRHEIPLGDQLMSLDPPTHTRHRTLAGRLFTPNRLKQNEDFILTLADQLIDEFADRGEVEFSAAYAKPFTLLVIADLLGVPHEDHETFRGWL